MRSSRLWSLLGAPATAALVLAMLLGCLFLWVGVPLIWLWIGSQVQASASLGTALLVTMTGILISVIVVVAGLGWLNRWHSELREARNLPATGVSALEAMLVVSAAIALVLGAIWFFGFAGTSPVPVELGY